MTGSLHCCKNKVNLITARKVRIRTSPESQWAAKCFFRMWLGAALHEMGTYMKLLRCFQKPSPLRILLLSSSSFPSSLLPPILPPLPRPCAPQSVSSCLCCQIVLPRNVRQQQLWWQETGAGKCADLTPSGEPFSDINPHPASLWFSPGLVFLTVHFYFKSLKLGLFWECDPPQNTAYSLYQ